MREIRREIALVQEQKEEIEEKDGTGLEMGSKIYELDLQERNLQKEYEIEKKDLAVAQKQAKSVEKYQKMVDKKAVRLAETKSKKML